MNARLGKMFVLIFCVFLFAAPVWGVGYGILKPIELKNMLENKDFFLLDVHVPEQIHIPGTDAFIDYRKMKKIIGAIPAEKDSKIVIYCSMGGMSRLVARNLAGLGYTNVYHLAGGAIAFKYMSSE